MHNWFAMIAFTLFVLGMLALDLGVFHRRPHDVSVREAAIWSGVWIALSIAAGIGLYFWKGPESGMQYFAAYLLEKSLSVDNVFLFTMIFSSLAVPLKYQHRLLFWGVLGALAMRAILIGFGAALISRFEWVLWLAGVLLIIAGIRLWRRDRKAPDPERNIAARWVRRLLPVVDDAGESFFLRRKGRWFATSLLLALVMIEVTDVVLALDSIPAVFSITRDPLIIYVSNILALLGLRSLYFVLAGVMRKLRYLHAGLATILMFVGLKMLLESFVQVPVMASLGVLGAILTITVFAGRVSFHISGPSKRLCIRAWLQPGR
jgi:tellurite resistance protein TerC